MNDTSRNMDNFYPLAFWDMLVLVLRLTLWSSPMPNLISLYNTSSCYNRFYLPFSLALYKVPYYYMWKEKYNWIVMMKQAFVNSRHLYSYEFVLEILIMLRLLLLIIINWCFRLFPLFLVLSHILGNCFQYSGLVIKNRSKYLVGSSDSLNQNVHCIMLKQYRRWKYITVTFGCYHIAISVLGGIYLFCQ